MELKLDANQAFQLEAIDAVADLFAGQEMMTQGVAMPGGGDGELGEASEADDAAAQGGLFSELVFGNQLALSAALLRRNLRAVQDRPVLSADGEEVPAISEGFRKELADGEAPREFSVEMETGTGKTYVYLRTIAELNRRYGWTKFLIVVPSVAIREGVLAAIKGTSEHLSELYDGIDVKANVYDGKRPSRVRQFATSSRLEVMVINIDSFAGDKTLIRRATDDLNGNSPIDFLSACRPVLILDEPQNFDTPIRRKARALMNPLVEIGYSATHRNVKHLVYRLTPVDAYDLRLVKRISVRGITKEQDPNLAFVEVKKVHATAAGVTATAVIQKSTKSTTRPTKVTLRKDADLVDESGGRDVYQGWIVEEIVAPADGAPGYVEFGNHIRIPEGSSNDEGIEQLQRIQIRQAIEAHFERERLFFRYAKRGVIKPMKPLTLFFVDKVKHYYPEDGKFRIWFEEEYEAVRAESKNDLLEMPAVADVHRGYFATTPKGAAKDTLTGETADAADAFDRIMRNKTRILDIADPLRFIFSHSALGEGWDNPNVFVICNLQDGKSTLRKRQQVGRGLRLPRMADGERCRVDEVNYLTVIANEAFESFAAALQDEIEDETGMSFSGRVMNERERVDLELKLGALDDPIFKELWEKIAPRTKYRLAFETPDLMTEAIKRVGAMEKVMPLRITVSEGILQMDAETGVGVADSEMISAEAVIGARRMPDILVDMSRRTPVSRATLAAILEQSGRLEEAKINPSAFVDGASAAVNAALYEQLVENIKYSPIEGERWEANEFVEHVSRAYESNVVAVDKSVTSVIALDSGVEREFAEFLDAREDVKLFLKLPSWFKVPTPLGGYNPDWAIALETADGIVLYFVRETKGGAVLDELQYENERLKILFGKAHFDSIGVDYAFGKEPAKLLEPTPPA
jgi:type III restriction enzyme